MISSVNKGLPTPCVSACHHTLTAPHSSIDFHTCMPVCGSSRCCGRLAPLVTLSCFATQEPWPHGPNHVQLQKVQPLCQCCCCCCCTKPNSTMLQHTCKTKHRPHHPTQSMNKWRHPRHKMKAHTHHITHKNPDHTHMPGQRDGRATEGCICISTCSYLSKHTHTQQAQACTHSNIHTHTRTQAACTEQAHAPSCAHHETATDIPSWRTRASAGGCQPTKAAA